MTKPQMTEKDLIVKLADARELMEALILDLPAGHHLRTGQERLIGELKARLANRDYAA